MRLVFLTHGSTSATRAADFPADEPLDARGRGHSAGLAGRLRRPGALRPLDALPPDRRPGPPRPVPGPVPDGDLTGPDHGRWTGRSLDDVAGAEPAGLRWRTTDPDAAPHGGESLTELTARIGR